MRYDAVVREDDRCLPRFDVFIAKRESGTYINVRGLGMFESSWYDIE